MPRGGCGLPELGSDCGLLSPPGSSSGGDKGGGDKGGGGNSDFPEIEHCVSCDVNSCGCLDWSACICCVGD